MEYRGLGVFATALHGKPLERTLPMNEESLLRRKDPCG